MHDKNILISFIILASAFSASYAQCDNVLLPSVGNLSQCLDRRLGACGTDSEEMTDDLEQFFDCVFEELPRITNPVAAFFNLEDVSQLVLSALELPVNVSSVARLLCYRLNFSLEACTQPAVSSGVRCGPLLSVYFPSSFAMRQCVDRSSLVCFEGEELSTRTLKQLFVVISCAFEGAPTSSQSRLARHLACPLVDLLRLSLRQFVEVITWPLFAEQVRDSVEQLATLLLHLASCQNGTTATTRITANTTILTLPASSTERGQTTATTAFSARSASLDPPSSTFSDPPSATESSSIVDEAPINANTSASMMSPTDNTAISTTPTFAPANTSSGVTTFFTSVSDTPFPTNGTTVATNSDPGTPMTACVTSSGSQGNASMTNTGPSFPDIGIPGSTTRQDEISTSSYIGNVSVNVTTVTAFSDSTSTNAFSTAQSQEENSLSSYTGPTNTDVATTASIAGTEERGTTSGNGNFSNTSTPPQGSFDSTMANSATVSLTTNGTALTSSAPSLSLSTTPLDESTKISASSSVISVSFPPTSLSTLSTLAATTSQMPPSTPSEATAPSFLTPSQASTPASTTAPAEGSESTSGNGTTASATVTTPNGIPITNFVTTKTSLVTTSGIETSSQSSLSSIDEDISSTSMSVTDLRSTTTRPTTAQASDDTYNNTSTQQYSTSQSLESRATTPVVTSSSVANISMTSVATSNGISVPFNTMSSRVNIDTISPGENTPQTAGTSAALTSASTATSIVEVDPEQSSPSAMPTSLTNLDTSSPNLVSNITDQTGGNSITSTASTKSEAEPTTADSRATASADSSNNNQSMSATSEPSFISISMTAVSETSESTSSFNSTSSASPGETTAVNDTNNTSLNSTTPSLSSTRGSSSSTLPTQDIDEPVIQTTTISTYVTSAVPTTSSSESCADITLPNIFGLDTCLGASLDVCSNENDAYESAGKVVRCTIRVLSASLSLQCVLAAVKDLIIAAFSRFSDEGDDSLSSLLSSFTCQNMALEGVSCNGNIQITFPRTFSQCINGTQLCRGQESVQESLVSSFLGQVKCILVTIIGDAPSSVLSGILCEVSSVLAEKVRQLPFFSFLRTLLKPVLQLLRRIVGCS